MKRIVFFLTVVFFSLLVIPAINIFSVPTVDAIKWNKIFLYNVDFASRWTAKLLYPFGISIAPKQVIIGKSGWLYLGDLYDQTLSVDRRPPTEADLLLGKQVGAAAEAWDAYLTSKGVKVFRVVIGPNKHTIYPEHMPVWARPASFNTTDALLAGIRNKIYIDLRPSLLTAKENQREDLYYKTDTHWNMLGGGYAFQAFAQQVNPVAPDIKWPSNKAYELVGVKPRIGGDLANFLRLNKSLSDVEPIIQASLLPIETTQYDFDTNKIIRQGGNPSVSAPNNPILVKSVGALNNKKVLWLRDSFGGGMSSLMAATFSDTLQLHWIPALRRGGRFAELIEKWKPDYVFITVVERSARNTAFSAFPPPVFISQSTDFQSVRSTKYLSSHHLISDNLESEFKISGNDPYMIFSLSKPMEPSEANYLSVDLTCADNSPSVPLQLFWVDQGRPYSEERSAKFLLPTGQHLIDLRTIPKWTSAASISKIRLDIIPNKSCSNFKLTNPSLGITNVAK